MSHNISNENQNENFNPFKTKDPAMGTTKNFDSKKKSIPKNGLNIHDPNIPQKSPLLLPQKLSLPFSSLSPNLFLPTSIPPYFYNPPSSKKSNENFSSSSKSNKNLYTPNSSPMSPSSSEKENQNENFIQNKFLCSDINKEDFFNFSKVRESNNVLLHYGEDCYKYNKKLEKNFYNIPANFLENTDIDPHIRTKMVDWMIEVLSTFNNNDETYFLAVNIMDMYLWKTKKKKKNSDVHLIGVTCMYMATKFQEIYPISLDNFVEKVSHCCLLDSDIKKHEYITLRVIQPESLVITSIYDFLKTYFCDFYFNNKNLIITPDDHTIFDYIKKCAIYLSKVCLHYEYFYADISSIKAVACIVCAVKIVSDNIGDMFTDSTKNVYNDWMHFLIIRGGYDKHKMQTLANKVYSAYIHYQKTGSRNLNRFTPLPFIMIHDN